MTKSLQTSSRYFDTIVIGAGISGLACAARLFQHQTRNGGIGSLKVLEARSRIGGRIGSVIINGCRLDTGANWIHGIGTEEEPNPLMKVLPHKRYRELSGSVLFRPPSAAEDGEGKDKGRVIPPEPAGTLMGTMWGCIGEMHSMAASTTAEEAKRTTLVEAVAKSEAFQDAFGEIGEEWHGTLRGLPQFIENMEAAPLVPESAEHDEEQPGVCLLEYAIEDFNGDQVFLQDGYIAVINEVAKELVDAGAIETEVEVEQINWDSDPIVLKTKEGIYEAKRVICTIPLGVLKERQKESSNNDKESRKPLFQPSLPSEKTQAISSLGFGTLDKIFLVYSHAWWTEEPYTSIWKDAVIRRPTSNPSPDHKSTEEPDSFMGFTNSLPGLSIDTGGKVDTDSLRILSLINLHSLTGFPVLSAFVSCSNAQKIEALSDKEAGALIHNSLHSWLGREPPKPEAVHVTRWASDPFSLGSYSNMITGVSETAHRETFQQPLRNKQGAELRFAGEHTSRNHFATVHGALLSGWREADDIIEGLGKTS